MCTRPRPETVAVHVRLQLHNFCNLNGIISIAGYNSQYLACHNSLLLLLLQLTGRFFRRFPACDVVSHCLLAFICPSNPYWRHFSDGLSTLISIIVALPFFSRFRHSFSSTSLVFFLLSAHLPVIHTPLGLLFDIVRSHRFPSRTWSTSCRFPSFFEMKEE